MDGARLLRPPRSPAPNGRSPRYAAGRQRIQMARGPPSPFPSISESISYFTDPFSPSFGHFTAMEDPTFPLCATTACSSFHLVIHLGIFLFLRLAFLAFRVLAEKGKRWREGRRKGMRGALCLQREERCAYAWRWATDIRAKQSKWLENNLRGSSLNPRPVSIIIIISDFPSICMIDVI